jgi:hypothetical protein
MTDSWTEAIARLDAMRERLETHPAIVRPAGSLPTAIDTLHRHTSLLLDIERLRMELVERIEKA